MRALIAATLLFVHFPIASAAVPGGKTCQVAESAVPTPGLANLITGSKTDPPVPAGVRLSEAQIDRLAELDTKLRKILGDVQARTARLPAGTKAAQSAELARADLPELVQHFLGEAARDRALLIDVESAEEFQLANAAALEAKAQGDKSRWCPQCLAVRRGMEADFAWNAGEFAALTSDQQKEADELAAIRGEVRRKWTAAVKSELTPAQLAYLRTAQMSWLKTTLHSALVDGMRTLGAKKCEACATTVEWKCEFCSIVLNAVDEAKARS